MIEIRPFAEADHAAWWPLWRGYQAFYQVDLSDEVSAVTWTRLLDPLEPMSGALACDGGEAVGLLHLIRTGPAGRSATAAICRIFSCASRIAGARSAADSSLIPLRRHEPPIAHVFIGSRMGRIRTQ